VEHPSDWRWVERLQRWEHPHSGLTISVIEPAKASERREPNAAFGFGRELKAEPPDDAVWEGMGL
jgi:hypothetical protein